MRKFAGLTGLALCLTAAFALCGQGGEPEKMEIPVTRVFAHVPAATATPLQQFKTQRRQETETEIAALRAAAQAGDAAAGEYLAQVIQRRETERAVESALAALGYADAVCAVREGAVMVCLQQGAEAAAAQQVIEISKNLSGECAENVFLLDECGYSW